jgi:hypothetical protein
MSNLWALIGTRRQHNDIAYSTASYLPRQLFGEAFDDSFRGTIWGSLVMTRNHQESVDVAQATHGLASGCRHRISSDHSGVQDVEAAGGRSVREAATSIVRLMARNRRAWRCHYLLGRYGEPGVGFDTSAHAEESILGKPSGYQRHFSREGK